MVGRCVRPYAFAGMCERDSPSCPIPWLSLSHMPTWSEVEARLRARLAANVRRLRELRGLTLEEAVKRAGVDGPTTKTWRRIERDESSITLRTIAQISVALDVSPLDLFADHG